MLVDLLLSYRAVKAWEDMIRLVEAMPEPVRRTVLVREQYGFALNRAERSDEAERVLRRSSRSTARAARRSACWGACTRIAGRRPTREGSALRAEGHLDQAIDAYRRGFEADWRDAYPGINAVTLMEIRDPGRRGTAGAGAGRPVREPPPDGRRRPRLLGSRHEARARGHRRATATRRWPAPALRLRRCASRGSRRATANNLALIRESRAERGETVEWADELERELLSAAGKD